MPLDKAYIYFFNDSDEPSFHASSGITRNFQPKPAYHAIAHLQATLGEYRFHKTITNDAGAVQVDEYQHGTDNKKIIWVAWLASGSDTSKDVTLSKFPGTISKAERMPLAKDKAANAATFSATGNDVQIKISETPVYLWITAP